MNGETNTDKLLDTLITQVANLTDSVNKLVILDAGRMEKDKHQDEKNKKFSDHVEKTSPVINRITLGFATWDKVKIPLIVGFIILVMTALNFNFAG